MPRHGQLQITGAQATVFKCSKEEEEKKSQRTTFLRNIKSILIFRKRKKVHR